MRWCLSDKAFQTEGTAAAKDLLPRSKAWTWLSKGR